ncbi:MAG TPA: pyroglutamyl-peptidase I, partial [Terriglobales bacterium]|nr:pyroglutamyl-peptidase I [Terriglobales bacterium]
FEPFGGATTNSSELVIGELEIAGDPDVITAVLPTSFQRAQARLHGLLDAHRPQALLMLGLHAGAPCVQLEQLALNLNDCIRPDNDGELRRRLPIIEAAPAAYRSTLPLERMAVAAEEMSQAVVFSHDPGCFVCNHVFFHAAHRAAVEAPSYRCGFVHLPDVQPGSDRLAGVVELVRRWVNDLAV